MSSHKTAYITGVAETDLGKVTNQSELSMAALAAKEALSEAGASFFDVDALFTNYMPEVGSDCSSARICEYFGIRPKYSDCSDMGGAAFEFFVGRALSAIKAGHCECALIVYASRQRSRRNRPRLVGEGNYSLEAQFEHPYGPLFPISQYALFAARHMYEFGTRPEQFAQVAVSARKWAALNPKAWSRSPITVDDVLNSPRISDPLHQLDCCLVTDGGGAVVIMNRERARDAAAKSVRVLGCGEAQSNYHIAQLSNLGDRPGFRSASEALGMAGVSPADADFFLPYDNFTSSVLLQMEEVGFCKVGEAGPFVQEGRTEPGGSLPTSTMGGGLSYCHPGALGLLLLIEAVRQLRGEAGDRQVPEAELGVVHAIGGPCFSAASTVVLGRD